MRSSKEQRPARSPWRRRLWPLAPLLLVGSALASVLLNIGYAALVPSLLVTVLPLTLAAVVAGLAVGGRRGAVVSVALLGLAGYWAWWFGWGLDANISAFSVEQAVIGLSDATFYVLGLAILLWPLLLVVVIVVVMVARRRRRPVGTALGVLCLALVVLSFPSVATWSDTCNDTSGAAPLVTRPATQFLMDRGVGVLPTGGSTLALCPAVGDRRWKPFWLGDDQLPPPPGVYGSVADFIQIPVRLYRAPTPLPGRTLDRVSLVYWPERDTLTAVVATDRELDTAPPSSWPPIDLRIGGVPFDDDEGLGVRGSRGWCYSAVWVRNKGIADHAPGTELQVDLEYRGRGLASGDARVRRITTDEQARTQGAEFGCPPKW